MPTIADAYVQIIPSAEGISGQLSNILNNEADSAGASSSGKFASVFSKGLKAVGKGAAIAWGATTAGIAALTKSSMQGYAEMEQLVGGVETLFTPTKSMNEFVTDLGQIGVSAQEATRKYTAGAELVKSNAAKAFKTAGISANEYMEQATSTAASMVSSLGGDTEKAAKLADQAITDMSDNANKMGTSIEMIQNAYGGFAKGNFTMLDNLKLGYGGTKEEMQRLLEDAEKLSGVEYDISSYSDIAEAVHVIQTEMGITGTTAKEASETISGSIGMMKASWSNMITGMADKNADLNGLINQFVESVGTVAGNILPVFQQYLNGAGELVEQLVPQIMDRVPSLISETLPSLVESGVSAVASIVEGIQENADLIGESAIEIINLLLTSLLDLLPELADAGLTIIESLISGLDMGEIIPAVVNIVLEIANTLINHVDDIIQAGILLMSGIIQGITSAIPIIIQALPTLITAILDQLIMSADLILQGATDMFMAIVDSIPAICSALETAIPAIVDAVVSFLTGGGLQKVLDGAITMLMAIIDAIPTIVSQLSGSVGVIVESVVTVLIRGVPQILKAGLQLLGGLLEAIPTIISKLVSAVPQIITSIAGALEKGLSQIVRVGENLMSGLWQGIGNKIGWVIEQVKGVSNKIVDAAKKIFKVNSPSKVFEDIGENLGAGLGIGWNESMDEVNKQINKDINYEGNVQLSTNFKDDFENGMQSVVGALGSTMPATAPTDNGLNGATIVINDQISLDGTPLKSVISEYTIRQIGNQTTAMKISKGGHNVL